MYAKLINNELIYAPKNIVHNNIIYTPATEEVLIAEGYKPVVYTEAPEEAEGFHNESFWEETETEIVQRWKAVADSPDLIVAKLQSELNNPEDTDELWMFLEWLLTCKNQSDFFKKLKDINDKGERLLGKRAEIREKIDELKNGKVRDTDMVEAVDTTEASEEVEKTAAEASEE